MIFVSAIIPTFNGLELLKENFLPLCQEMEASLSFIDDYEIIVVDDCSADESVGWLKALPFYQKSGKIKIIVNESNRGFAYSVNRGVHLSEKRKEGGDFILLLNNDIKVTSGFLKPLFECFSDGDRQVFAVGNMAIDDKGGKLTKTYVMTFRFGMLRETFIPAPEHKIYGFGASGGHGLFDKRKFIELGGFDEELFSPFYWEDADLAYRAWKKGYAIYYEPSSRVIHKSGATIVRFNRRYYVDFISRRNYFLLHWKNITDGKYIALHLLFLPLNIFVMTLKNPIALFSFFAALFKLPLVLKKRRREKINIILSDEEVYRLWQEPLKYLQP